MPRSPFSRLLAAALFTLVTFAVPGDALAHGEAHHREHAGDSHHAVADTHDVGTAVSAPDHGHDHQHPQIDRAARTRVDTPSLVATEPVLVPSARVISLAPVTPRRPEMPTSGDPHTGPPPRLRAPPAR